MKRRALLGDTMAISPPIEPLEDDAGIACHETDRGGMARGRVLNPLNSLIGREHELIILRQFVTAGDARLITLTGPGGVGKTRLALALAADVAETSDDAVVFVPLAPVRDATLVAAAIAQRLDVPESGERPLVMDVIARLQDARCLLVLDNFEHLLAAAPLVGDLLGACPRLRVLATGRRRLGLSGEHEIPVAPLDLADPSRTYDPADLARVPAVRLFVERARAASPGGFALTEENGLQVAEICWRLDGLPLAIELAAPRTRLLSPAALLSRLTNRLQLLTNGPRDTPERHQTMRQAIAWSYALLDPAAQRLLRRAAVFVGGFTLEGVEAVGGADAPETTLDVLAELVAESLVQSTEQPDGERRFAMLETVREYAIERLGETGEGTDTRRRHAEYFIALAERADPGQSIVLDWLDRLQTEHANLRAALAWGNERAPATALRLAGSLWRFWSQRGYWSEGRRWLEQSLAAGVDAAPAMRAVALAGAGTLAREQGDFVAAQRWFAEQLALARRHDDARGAAQALRSLGIVASDQSAFDHAVPLIEEALDQFRAVGEPLAVARCLTDLGLIASRQDRHRDAISSYEEALPLVRAAADQGFAALLLSNLGGAYISAGDLARGEALTAEALDQSRILGDRFGVAINLFNLADCVEQRGEMITPWEWYRESLVITHELGERHLASRILDRIARLLTIGGVPRTAAHVLGAAAAHRRQIGDALFPSEEASVAETIATTQGALGEEAFRAAWDAGSALAPAEAVAEALAIETLPGFVAQQARRLAREKLGVSAREVEVLQLVAMGRADKEIAAALGISRHTVAKHVAALRAKLDAPSRTGAVNTAREAGLL